MEAAKNSNSKSFQDLKCIWMSSNVVDYKLCDKAFDCENCTFDRVIRNMAEEAVRNDMPEEKAVNPMDDIISRIKNQSFEPKNIYLRNQIVVKHLFANTYYMGLNPAALLFLDNVEEVQDGGNQGYIRKNQALFNLKGEWGYVTITSPMNFTLLDKLAMTPCDFINKKWFAIISAVQPEITTSKLNREQWQVNQINSIRMMHDIKKNYPSVGATMMDGGTPVKYLNKVVGNNNYLKILNKLFNE